MRRIFIRTLLGVAAPVVALALATAPALAASGQSTLATQSGQDQASPVPPPPLEPGCYAYSYGTTPSGSVIGWVAQPCLSSATVLQEGPPPTAPLGIQLPPPGPTGRSGALDGSYVYDTTTNTAGGSVYSTGFGGVTYSLQNNTNFFTGNNGATDWVQFVFQQVFPGPNNRACIWQVNVTLAQATKNTQGYNATGCYALSARPETIWGAAFSTPPSPRGPGGNYLVMQTLDLSGAIHATIQPDYYGLATNGNWTAASGGILGAGGGAEAIFSPGWSEHNALGVTDCSPIISAPCAGGALPAATAEFPSNVTAESSNLVPTSIPTVNWGAGHHTAYITYDSTA